MTRFGWIVAAVMLLLPQAADAQQARGRAQGTGTATPAPGRAAAAAPAKTSPGAGPVIVVDTVKGTFEFETYPNEAPKSVEHILALIRRNFYNGQRVHRQVPGFVVQFGDPLTRDMTRYDFWGTGGSGKEIGVSEVSPKRKHIVGAVALAHPGDGRRADSQMYVTLAAQPKLDKDFTVIGQVISGLDVVQKLKVNDVIRRVSVKGEASRLSPR